MKGVTSEGLRSGAKGGLERHRYVLIGVDLIDHRFSLGLAETTVGVGGTDLEQGTAPTLLSRNNLSLGEIAVQHLNGGGSLSLEAETESKSWASLKEPV